MHEKCLFPAFVPEFRIYIFGDCVDGVEVIGEQVTLGNGNSEFLFQVSNKYGDTELIDKTSIK